MMKKSKKTFKRVLAVALAALMVGSSLPLASFAVGAATQQDMDVLNQYMSQYETKMNGTIYKNMKPAYDKYIEALKAKDAFVSGKNTNQNLAQLANDLQTAYNNMTPWDPKAPTPSTVTPSFRDDTKDTVNYKDAVYKDGVTHQGLLYAPLCNASNGMIDHSSMDAANTEWKICYPTYVAVYDGYNTPKMPVMSIGRNYANAGKFNFGAYPTADATGTADNSIINLENYWRAPVDTSDENNKNVPNKMDFIYYFYNGNQLPTYHATNGTGYNEATGKQGNHNQTHKGVQYVPYSGAFSWKTYYERYQSNVMVLNPTFTMGADQYSQTINETYWYTAIGGDADTPGVSGKTIAGHLTATGHPIYLLNIKTLNDSAIAFANKLDLANAEKITVDSANYSALLDKLDAATGFSLAADYAPTQSEPNKTANTVAAKATEIQNAKSAMDTATINAAQDGDRLGYTNLRTAISENTATVNAGQGDYTKDTWDAYVAAYNAGVTHMSNMNQPSASYANYADAKILADNIVSTKAALKTSVVKVDTKTLEEVIENANVAIVTKNFLTSTPSSQFGTNFNALNSAINNAKEEIWVGASNYPSEGTKLKDSPENQAKVTAHINAIGEALVKLELSYDAPVPKADNKSMNYYLGEAAKLVPQDYSNFATVETAVAAANAFKDSDHAFKSEKGSVQTVVKTYVDKTRELYVALVNLQPGFAKIADGTVINPGAIKNSYFDSVMQSSQRVWGLSLDYMNDQILFRTTNEPFTYNISNFAITFTNPNNDYDQFLDSINLDEKVDAHSITDTNVMWRPKSNEINSDISEIAMSDIQKGTFKAGLSLSRDIAGTTATFALNEITVSEIHTNYQGRTIAGADVPLGEAHNWGPELSSVEGTANPCTGGVPVAKGKQTRLLANGHFSLPATTAPTLSASTKPTVTTYAPQDAYFSGIVRWHYNPTNLTRQYYGYGTERAMWYPSVTVVDVSTLFTLMNQSADIINNHSAEYTPASIQALNNALNTANANFEYGKMTGAAVQAECATRYDNLWTAYNGLQKAVVHEHVWGEWQSNNDGANHIHYCTAPGCTDPVAFETQACTAGPEEIDQATVVAPTCNKAGSHDVITKCTVCGQVLSRRNVIDPATGQHTWGDWTPNNDHKTHSRVCTNEGCQEKETANCTYTASTTKKPSCTETGIKTYTCSVCGDSYTETIKKLDHKRSEPQYKAPTANENGYRDRIVCTVCGTILEQGTVLDAKAYLGAVEVSDTVKNSPDYTDKYSQEARDTYEKAIADAKIDLNDPNTTQDAIDQAASKLAEAKSTLEAAPKAFTVKLQAVVNGVAGPTEVVKTNVAYGTAVNIDATDKKGSGFISNWDVYDESTKGTTKMHTTKDALDFTVTSNTIVKVYITNEPGDGKNYTKVTLYNELGSVYNISYVQDISSIDLSAKDIVINGTTFKAPAKPFYNFDRWTATNENGEYSITPNYTFIEASASYSQLMSADGVAKINGVSQHNSKYDWIVDLSGGEAYAIVANNDPSQIITYVNGNRIHVPHNERVYVVAVSKADLANATSGITGSLIKDKSAQYGAGMRGATFNCMFNLPEGATLVECGAVGTNKQAIAQSTSDFVIGGKNVFKFKSDSTSKFNEYNICFIANFPVGSTFYGRSYVVYNDSTGQHTIYGDMSQIVL